MTFVDHYENKTHVYEKFVKKNKCVRTNSVLENGLMYLYHCLRRTCGYLEMNRLSLRNNQRLKFETSRDTDHFRGIYRIYLK